MHPFRHCREQEPVRLDPMCGMRKPGRNPAPQPPPLSQHLTGPQLISKVLNCLLVLLLLCVNHPYWAVSSLIPSAKAGGDWAGRGKERREMISVIITCLQFYPPVPEG